MNKKIKIIAEKSFSVFNGVLRWLIEHTKTFLTKCFIMCYQRTWTMFVFKLFLNFNICVTKMFFLMKIQKQGFQTWKTLKKPPKKNVFQKKFLSDLIIQLLILFVSWKCCDPSAHTDVFEKLLLLDWLCCGLIHLKN